MLRACGAALLLAACAFSAGAAPDARLTPGAALGELPRFGVNLGGRSSWGAEQLMANVLRNPGLEPVQDGALVIVGRATTAGVEDDTPWTARPPGFWAGAHFEVLSGAASGQAGRVLDNQRAGAGRGDLIALQPLPPGVQAGDVIALQAEADPAAAPLWWTQGTVASVAQPRPGSPGRRSVRLTAVPGQPAALHHHLDTIGARAGKLLPVQGRWRLALWVRGGTAATPLRLQFGRQSRPAWLDRRVAVGAAWQHVVHEFDARDDGPPGTLTLTLATLQGDVQIDDVELGAAVPPQPGGFRAEVVQTLRALKPGYLRDWQGQLADTPANREAEPFARRPVRYRPGAHEMLFGHSLPEFMALASGVGARPWVVLPATSTPGEARAFGQALRRAWQAHGFDEVVVEHGNEHWNSIFRPAGIANAARLAEVADRAFAALREGAGAGVPLHLVIGTQHVNPAATGHMARLSGQISGVAVAPYFHYRQEAGDSAAAALSRALHETPAALQQAREATAARGKSLDVYEVNFHTTAGSATPAQRDAVVTAPAAGAALARRLLQAAALGVTRQAVYTLAGYDSFVDGGRRELVQLFGITRDLAVAEQWRPTGHAVVALNAVVGGAAHTATCSGAGCAEITAMAFGDGTRWAVVSSAAVPIQLAWPCRGDQQVQTSSGAATRVRCVGGEAVAVLAAQSWMTARAAAP